MNIDLVEATLVWIDTPWRLLARANVNGDPNVIVHTSEGFGPAIPDGLTTGDRIILNRRFPALGGAPAIYVVADTGEAL